ncbi:agmatine deiminase family protein [Bacillus paramycoides]|uniref:agmatine deiminase family protein n=1 Tax=Bacillus paramycoides TaxID=2026194 RepID=UPI003D215E6A
MEHIQGGIIFTAIPDKSNEYYRPFYEDLIYFNENLNENKAYTDQLISLSIEEQEFHTSHFEYDDIWLRDVAPVVTNHLVKFKYQPNYLPKNQGQYLNQQFNKWLGENDFKYVTSPLILDGGNLIWNKKDTVILTERIFDDNYDWTEEEIIEQLEWDLDVSRVIIIPAEPGDVLAHADGMVKFIDNHIMFISDFLGDHEFRHSVQEIIQEQMPEAEFIVVPSSYTEKEQYDQEIASAKGLYINMLETNDTIYVPKFGLARDKEVFQYIQKHTDKHVIQVHVGEISTMGGAINCLTWYCPNHLVPSKIKRLKNQNEEFSIRKFFDWF